MKRNRFWAAVSKVLAVIAVTLIITLVLASGAGAANQYKILHQFSGTDGSDPLDA